MKHNHYKGGFTMLGHKEVMVVGSMDRIPNVEILEDGAWVEKQEYPFGVGQLLLVRKEIQISLTQGKNNFLVPAAMALSSMGGLFGQ